MGYSNLVIWYFRCFRPLALEECRCSILHGGTENKLQGFPLRITRSMRSSNDILSIAKSDKTIRSIQITQNHQIQNQSDDDSIPEQQIQVRILKYIY